MINDSKSIFSLYAESVTMHTDSNTEGQPGDHDETDMSNPEEAKEIEIFKAMLRELHYADGSVLHLGHDSGASLLDMVKELLKMHGQSTELELPENEDEE